MLVQYTPLTNLPYHAFSLWEAYNYHIPSLCDISLKKNNLHLATVMLLCSSLTCKVYETPENVHKINRSSSGKHSYKRLFCVYFP